MQKLLRGHLGIPREFLTVFAVSSVVNVKAFLSSVPLVFMASERVILYLGRTMLCFAGLNFGIAYLTFGERGERTKAWLRQQYDAEKKAR